MFIKEFGIYKIIVLSLQSKRKQKRMKSIKEKAKEVFPEHCNFYTNICNERKRIGFVDGANYVLDEIESLIKNVSDEYPRFQQGTIIYIRLIKLLEQLKK